VLYIHTMSTKKKQPKKTITWAEIEDELKKRQIALGDELGNVTIIDMKYDKSWSIAFDNDKYGKAVIEKKKIPIKTVIGKTVNDRVDVILKLIAPYAIMAYEDMIVKEAETKGDKGEIIIGEKKKKQTELFDEASKTIKEQRKQELEYVINIFSNLNFGSKSYIDEITDTKYPDDGNTESNWEVDVYTKKIHNRAGTEKFFMSSYYIDDLYNKLKNKTTRKDTIDSIIKAMESSESTKKRIRDHENYIENNAKISEMESAIKNFSSKFFNILKIDYTSNLYDNFVDKWTLRMESNELILPGGKKVQKQDIYDGLYGKLKTSEDTLHKDLTAIYKYAFQTEIYGMDQFAEKDTRIKELQEELEKRKQQVSTSTSSLTSTSSTLPNDAIVLYNDLQQMQAINNELLIEEIKKGNLATQLTRLEKTYDTPIKYKIQLLKLNEKGALTREDMATVEKTRKDIEREMQLLQLDPSSDPDIQKYKDKLMGDLKDISKNYMTKYDTNIMSTEGDDNKLHFATMSAKRKQEILRNVKL
jgi:hypothetical protein